MVELAADTLFRCPECHGTLAVEEDRCVCTVGHSYDVTEGVFDLVPDSLQDDSWSVWSEHLAAFQRRREERVEHPHAVTTRVTGRNDQQAVFADFIDPAGTTWLDVGCGPGKFGRLLPAGTRYVGVDPIPLLPDVHEIEFARAVSERLPFDDATFSDAVILHALDHLKDAGASLREIRRVLRPDGRLHVLQNVVEKKQVLRYLAHELKDFVEDRRDAGRSDETPHHMTEFSVVSLREALAGASFVPHRERFWAPNPFSPRRMMVTSRAG